ncbi:MAG TPA: hypothetical protein VFZ09_43585 [Archangium sp.]|uniref:hypothetical protein n=1 Tax=Archangium sp. TaxID=1872627 RepID=UPI002E30A36F|nr:hypothetical protein [Archangium sp.]HEX5753163.1 hypothetical protein [Archangium sp.]
MGMGRGKAALRREYEALKRGGTEAHTRGRRLEGLVYELLESESLHPRRNLRPPGEEIDISFTDGHRHFLLEARKLTGTLGVFLYIGAEFSKAAIQALTWGKEINTVLVNEQDMSDALSPVHSFREVLDLKLRHAARFGECHIPYMALLESWRRR